MVQRLVPEYISHRCKFIIGAAFVELLDIFKDVIGEGEVLFSDVLNLP